MKCPSCRKGKVIAYGDEAPKIGFNRVYALHEVDCPDCHGTGHYELCECGVVLEEGHVCEAA